MKSKISNFSNFELRNAQLVNSKSSNLALDSSSNCDKNMERKRSSVKKLIFTCQSRGLLSITNILITLIIIFGKSANGSGPQAEALMLNTELPPQIKVKLNTLPPDAASLAEDKKLEEKTLEVNLGTVSPVLFASEKNTDFGLSLPEEDKNYAKIEDDEEEDKMGQNETLRERDALQEEGSHHQPVVFIGGPGYVPPSSTNLRPRPNLETESWSHPPPRPNLDSRFPLPFQSSWDRNYRNPFNLTRVQHIEAECQDDFMKLRVSFNGSFQGLIYSSGFAYDNDCVYVNGTGRDYYEYLIRLNRCGTLGASNHIEGRKEPSKNFMWNTVTVQYNPMIEEEWDEHFKVTCEYGYDFWKTVTFKPFDVEVATGNPVLFTLSPPECYMEVRYGFGSSGTRVGGPVRVGDPLTLMIYMRSQFDGFDLVVNDCYAHNGGTKRIQLIDHYGCPVDSKLMSPFRGTWSHTNVYETQVYAYLKTFRFTGSPALYIECDVRMCHGQCPSQPCYWRNVKNIQKRSINEDGGERNGSLSESVNLSQALTVLQDKEEETSSKIKSELSDSVCLKSNVFNAIFGFGLTLLGILGLSSAFICIRLRRAEREKNILVDDELSLRRPYATNIQNEHRSHYLNKSNSRLT